MIEATFLSAPGMRRSSILRILAAVAVLTLAPACELVVEYDYLGAPAPDISATYPTIGGITRSIEGVYETAGFDDVWIEVNPVPSNNVPSTPCITDAFLDANFALLEDHRPTGIKKLWRWYAHGLMVEEVCGALLGAGGASGFQGALWFPPVNCGGQNCPHSKLTREKFLVNRKSVAEIPAKQVRVAVHELAHVFNLHHCDLDADDVDIPPTGFEKQGPNGRCLTHLIEHKKSHESFVRPGPDQEPFCGTEFQMPPVHEAMHLDQANKGTTTCVKACSSLSSLLKEPVPLFQLRLEPEKSSFAPGEPVLLRVALEAGSELPPGASYYGERSLDPQLHHLRIWSGTDEQDLRPMVPLLMVDAELESAPFPGRVEASGLDAWFLLPFDLETTVDTLFAQATFNIGGEIARSPVLAVAVNRPPTTGAADPQVLELFTHSESRRFLYFLGGDHLARGRANLEQVAALAPGTVYGTYADLALGISMALPFQRFDNKAGMLLTRPADPTAARTFLDRAHPFIGQLPPTRRRNLTQVRALVYESLGDEFALSDPQAAIELYRQAMEMFRTLPEMPRPLTMTRAEYDAKIDEQVRRVQQKLVQLPQPGLI